MGGRTVDLDKGAVQHADSNGNRLDKGAVEENVVAGGVAPTAVLDGPLVGPLGGPV